VKARHLFSGNSPFDRGADGAATAESASSLNTERLLTPPRSLLGGTIAPSGRPQLKIVILGPSLTTSLGNSAASTYRGLVRELAARGHEVLFLQRGDEKNDGQKMPRIDSGRVEEYSGLKDLKNRHAAALRDADFVLLASQIMEAVDIGDWITRHAQGVTAFYDLSTLDTMAAGPKGESSISAGLISRFNLYLSFAGGPLLDQLEDKFGSPMARPLYPAVDARLFFPEYTKQTWDLGFIGRHSDDCLPVLERLLLEPARRWDDGRFIVAGSWYPRSLRWPGNVKRIPQISPQKRRAFYNSQRFTLDLMPPDTLALGYSPSARLFEAAACGTPVITEFWPGLDAFFTPDEEILVSHSADETMIYLEEISEPDRRRMGYRARERVLSSHTTRHRAAELESYILELRRNATS
jgi:spore maturation protein CgeB